MALDLIDQICEDLESWYQSAIAEVPAGTSPKDEEIVVAEHIMQNYHREIEGHLRGIKVALGNIGSAHDKYTDPSTRAADLGRRDQLEELQDVLIRKARGEPSIAVGEEVWKPVEKSIAEKGLIGEIALNEWFKSIGISYLYINQSPDSFANLFKGNLKRPDFLVLLESVGIIAVDAKNYKPFNGEYSLPLETELKRVLTFERLFRIPVWYAYLGKKDNSSSVWYWISALKALEVGQVKKNFRTGEEFLAIKLENFERIEKNEDIGKLYTHRLPSLKKIAAGWSG